MATFCEKLPFVVGLLALLHTAYSAAQYAFRTIFVRNIAVHNRTYLRITEQEFTSLPQDIIIQGFISLLATMYGILNIAGNFKEIRSTLQLQNRSWESIGNRPTFYTFCHRGHALSPNYNRTKLKCSGNNEDSSQNT